VAYADFVTAMMALFIVLWLMNSSQQVKEAVGGYFKDPSGTSKMVGTDQSGSGENLLISKDKMSELKQQLQKAVRRLNDFDKMKSQIEMTVTAEGLRIELLESANGTFFDSGSARPSDSGKELLGLLAKELGSVPNKLSIEGHTDSKPYSGGGDYGNWELSADRANAARRLMQAQDSPGPGGAGPWLCRPNAAEDPRSPGSFEPPHFGDRPIPGWSHQIAPNDPKDATEAPVKAEVAAKKD
jgi:chemotaxis protein MotB